MNNKDLDPDTNFFNTELTNNNCTYYLADEFNNTVCTRPASESFSLMHINCNSVLGNFEKFVDLNNSVNNIFDVVVVSETHLDGTTDDLINLSGYTFIGKPRKYKQKGGVGIYLKSNLNYKIRPDITSDNEVFELLTIEIVNPLNKNIIVVAVYRPPGTDIVAFNSMINVLCDNIKNENKLVYWAGDFNINLLNAESHRATNDFLNIMMANSMYPAITKPTRITEYSATIIDNIYCNTMLNSFTGIIYKEVSDHLPIFIMNEIKVNKRKIVYSAPSRNHCSENTSKLKEKLAEFDWSPITGSTNAEKAYHDFLNNYTKLYEECCPMQNKARKYTIKKSWMTPALMKSRRTKEKLFKKYQENPTAKNKQDYCLYKNKFTTLKRQSEKQYYGEKLEQAKSNLRETWKIIKNVMNKNQTVTVPQDSFRYKDSIIDNPQEISNKFNEFFVNIGPVLDSKIPQSEVDFNKFLSKGVDDSFFIAPTSSDEIIRTIDSCKSKHSSGLDKIAMTLIKSTGSSIAIPLAHICNLSFITAHVPTEMKIARVTPIYKSDAPDNFSNYRPISLLPNFSKILEKLMFNRVVDFLDKYKVLYEQQYGFRKNYSTEYALIELSDKIAQAIDKKEFTVGIFIDLSKAFDTLNHEILLKKLAHYGIRGVANDWFRAYLCDRCQFVSYNNVLSAEGKISTGVPQGSILGPLLFLLYINDICESSRLLHFILYADDTNIFCSNKNIVELCNIVNRELQCVAQWFRANRLSVNIKKTNFVIFGTQANLRNKTNCRIFMEKLEIAQTNTAKFLGVLIDCNLNWKSHIDYISKKIAKNVGIIKRLRHCLPIHILNTLYNTLILPYLSYCNIIWANNKPTRLQSLMMLQKKIVRVNTASGYYSHALPLFGKLNQLTVFDLNRLFVATFMYRFHFNCLPPMFSDYFIENSKIHNHFTRNSSKLHIAHARTDIMKHQIRVSGPKIWNSVDPAIIKISNNWRSFKKQFKKHLMIGYS